jgi:hypothetical protein
MGIMPCRFSSSSFDEPKKYKEELPNPNPYNFKISQYREIGNYLIVFINYPDCTNYEGNKILVFKDARFIDLTMQEEIDPHFSENKTKLSPIARFVPSNEGWFNAISFANMKLINQD